MPEDSDVTSAGEAGPGGPWGSRRALEAQLLLVAVTVVWGITFSLTKMTLDEGMPTFVFLAWRFWFAFFATVPFAGARLRRTDSRTLGAGLLLGAMLFMSYAFQTFGLEYTTAGNAGFITGLFIVFTPLLSVIIGRERLTARLAAAVAVALVGLGFLSVRPGFAINAGDALVLVCALSYSVHIILLDRYVKRYDLLLLTIIQMGFLAVSNTAGGLIFEQFQDPGSAVAWVSILVCGLLASSAAFYIQGWAQRVIPPTRTAMVLVMEPVFSVIFGIVLLGERLSWGGWLGCALIFAGMILAETRPAADR